MEIIISTWSKHISVCLSDQGKLQINTTWTAWPCLNKANGMICTCRGSWGRYCCDLHGLVIYVAMIGKRLPFYNRSYIGSDMADYSWRTQK